MKGILGKKIGMTQIFDETGKLIPITIVEITDCKVLAQKTKEKDGYEATQLGFDTVREQVLSKAEVGHAKKANSVPKRFVKEIEGNDMASLEIGSVVGGNIFKEGEIVDVTGITKGKGFQGVVKRYGFHIGARSHGSGYHRGIGSMGSINPARVKKGKKMPGRMGNQQVTIQNLQIVKVDLERNVLLIQGSVPGAKKSYCIVKSSVKQGNPSLV